MKESRFTKQIIRFAALMFAVSAAAFSGYAEEAETALSEPPQETEPAQAVDVAPYSEDASTESGNVVSDPFAEDAATTVRVGLFFGQTARDSITLTGSDGYYITVETYDEAPAFIDVNSLTLTVSGGSLHVLTAFGSEVASAESTVKIRIAPAAPDDILSLDGKSYRGTFEFYADASGKITAINRLNIEQYLQGVLPSEVYPSWNMEALKAAAVASRTYALKSAKASSHSASGFDVCSNTHCQMYDGTAKEHERTNQAIADTAGLVVKYDGSLAMTPYHSSSGGYTESAAAAWGSDPADYPYLTSVFTPYEDYRGVPNGKWLNIIGPEELLNHIPASYTKSLNGGIADLEFNRAPNGYNESMTVTDGSGSKFALKTSGSVRSFFGSLVKSPNFGIARTVLPSDKVSAGVSVISADGAYELTGIEGYTVLTANGEQTCAGFEDVLVFDGQGYGHGVGLSQFGSRCMADAGFTYDEILQTYFPGTVIEPLFQNNENQISP